MRKGFINLVVPCSILNCIITLCQQEAKLSRDESGNCGRNEANGAAILMKAAQSNPDSKIHGANMGPIWGRQDPCVPHVGPMNLVIR